MNEIGIVFLDLPDQLFRRPFACKARIVKDQRLKNMEKNTDRGFGFKADRTVFFGRVQATVGNFTLVSIFLQDIRDVRANAPRASDTRNAVDL